MPSFKIRCPWCGVEITRSTGAVVNGKSGLHSGLCNKCHKHVKWWYENGRGRIERD